MNYEPNHLGLPEPYYRALVTDEYVRAGDYSATSLVVPVQAAVLEERHRAEITRDPLARIPAMIGTAIHAHLERFAEGLDDWDAEVTLTALAAGRTIGSTFDLYDRRTATIWDYKNPKRSSYAAGLKFEWEVQMNVYAWLARRNALRVERLRVLATYIDWSAPGRDFAVLRGDADAYPEHQPTVYEVPVWSDDDVTAYIHERIDDFERARSLSDDELPECTPEERWRRDRWAVQRPGAVRAPWVFATREEAEAKLASVSDEYVLRHRPDPKKPMRCRYYCAAAAYCHQLSREGW